MARILIVDDDDTVRTGVRRFLRRLGHEVLEAVNGGEALRSLAGQGFDLVVTDINMPDTDGIELIIQLTARSPDLPIIAISGGGLFPKDLLLANAEALGVRRTLAKPFDLADLAKAVKESLEG